MFCRSLCWHDTGWWYHSPLQWSSGSCFDCQLFNIFADHNCFNVQNFINMLQVTLYWCLYLMDLVQIYTFFWVCPCIILKLGNYFVYAVWITFVPFFFFFQVDPQDIVMVCIHINALIPSFTMWTHNYRYTCWYFVKILTMEM